MTVRVRCFLCAHWQGELPVGMSIGRWCAYPTATQRCVGLSLVGVSAQVSVSFMGCSVAAVRGCFVVAFEYAMFCVVRGDARPLLLSPCNTCIHYICTCMYYIYTSMYTVCVHVHTMRNGHGTRRWRWRSWCLWRGGHPGRWQGQPIRVHRSGTATMHVLLRWCQGRAVPSCFTRPIISRNAAASQRCTQAGLPQHVLADDPCTSFRYKPLTRQSRLRIRSPPPPPAPHTQLRYTQAGVS